MPEGVTGSEAVAFEQELRTRSPALLRFTLLMGTLAFAGMSLVDPQLITGPDLEFALWSRLVTCVAFIAGILLTWVGDWAERWARPASIVACALTGLEVILLSYLTGGSSSSYHEALHVTMFGYAILPFPWRRFDGALTFTFFIAAYCGLLVLGDRVENVTDLFSKIALLAVSAMVAGTFERVIKNRHLSDFRSRAALATANERLKSLDLAKNRFFSNISHELRTPLTLIVAPLEALIESTREPLSAGQRERLLLAQRNALRLLRLVDDLLSLTKAEAASLKLHVSRVELGRFVSDFTHDVAELAARKHIAVDLRVPDHPVFAEVDPTLIERVLLNVFGNAAKFVDLGGHIEVTVEEADGGVEIAVADNGIGISEAHLPRIFDRFYQAESASTRTSGGTGIGLSLVKEIAELHGGRVRAESRVGEGTRIVAWFPLALPSHVEDRVVRSEPGSTESGLPEWHQAIRAAKSYRFQGIDDVTERRVAPRPSARGDAPTVLVVEDNPDMIRFLVALLAYDYNVLTAQNGKDGLKMALERGPDLIISDVMMPEMDGFETLKLLREISTVPVILLTVRGSSEDRIQGHSGGADTYLAKPFRSEELLAAVDALITRQKSVLDSASSREDEALVFMASGIHERLAATMAELRALQSTLASPGRGPSGPVEPAPTA
ncbi:MAG TPA: ATP-binding protein, partial [Myxococcota bacterium]|nr:ATP-binding protein [Myxococcota bacterium]